MKIGEQGQGSGVRCEESVRARKMHDFIGVLF